MTRRAWLLAVPFALWADDRTDALDSLAPFASALAEGDAGAALQLLPRDATELRDNVLALLARGEVTSSVDVAEATKGSAELDWYLEIRERATQTVIERRKGKVRLTHRKGRIVTLEPASFFAPPARG